MSGTINISRQIWESTAFAPCPFSEREAWIWMICEASWMDRTKRVGDFVVTLSRGDLAMSSRFSAKAWGWTDSKVRRYLERLKKLGMITSKTDAGVTVISICNYDKFQNSPQGSDAGPTHVRRTSDANYNKGVIRVKEGEEVEAKASKQKRRCRLPDGWVPSPRNMQDAAEKGFTERDAENEADKFRDYHIAKGTIYADWDAGWRTWIGRARPNAGGNARSGSAHQNLFDGFQRAALRDESRAG